MIFHGEKTGRWPLRVSLLILIAGGLMQTQHWPYGKEVVAAGAAGLLVFYPVRFFAKKGKQWLDYVKLLLIPLWAITTVLRVYHLPYANVIGWAPTLLFLVWFFSEGTCYIRAGFNDQSQGKWLGKTVFGVAAGLSVLGILFKIQHWPAANIMLILGVALIGIWLMMGE